MIVGTCGFGSTGSSAVSDYLAEYTDIQVLDGMEFTFVSDPDSLIDLRYHLFCSHKTYYDSQLAFKRFIRYFERNKRTFRINMGIDESKLDEIVNDFVGNVTGVKWKNYIFDDDRAKEYFFKDSIFRRRIIKGIEECTHKRYNGYPLEDAILAVSPENFDLEARKLVKNLLKLAGANFQKCVVLDQPFAGNNPQACFRYFDDPFAIVVDRDPRDNYVFAMTKLFGRNHYMPLDTVHDYVKYYRALREGQPYKETNDRVLKINFEDFVYEYDKTSQRISEFLNLGPNPRPQTIFQPSMSVANTQVYKKFPEFINDIKYIEENLSEYLFEFEKYPNINTDGKMFFGKSPFRK